MKKFILDLILFTLILVVFYTITLIIWGTYVPSIFKQNLNYRVGSYGHMYSRVSEVKNIENLDILFLGSSTAYRGFDTRIYSKSGLNTFNLGSSAQTPIQSKVLVNRYIDKLNPKTVIYAVHPTTFSLEGVESSLDLIANDRNDIFSLNMAFKINNIKTYNTLLYGLYRDFLNPPLFYSEPIIKGNDTYISGGFVEKKIDYFKPNIFDIKEITINKMQLNCFSEIILLLESKGINVILVYAPIPSSKYNSYSNNSYFDSLMKSFAEYYNFNELIFLEDSLYFYDEYHMNQNGVVLFNKKILGILNDDKNRSQH